MIKRHGSTPQRPAATRMSGGVCAPLVHLDSGRSWGEFCSVTMSVVIEFWVAALCAERVKLELGLAALAEHLDEGRGVFGDLGIHAEVSESQRPAYDSTGCCSLQNTFVHS